MCKYISSVRVAPLSFRVPGCASAVPELHRAVPSQSCTGLCRARSRAGLCSCASAVPEAVTRPCWAVPEAVLDCVRSCEQDFSGQLGAQEIVRRPEVIRSQSVHHRASLVPGLTQQLCQCASLARVVPPGRLGRAGTFQQSTGFEQIV